MTDKDSAHSARLTSFNKNGEGEIRKVEWIEELIELLMSAPLPSAKMGLLHAEHALELC